VGFTSSERCPNSRRCKSLGWSYSTLDSKSFRPYYI